MDIQKGTRLIALLGAVANDDNDEEVVAPPGTEGEIIDIDVRQSGTIYHADFAGVWVCLDSAELADVSAYTILDTPSASPIP